MFTGIIETQAELLDVQSQGSNLQFTFTSKLASEFKVDQSVSHNGVCLTVEEINEDTYRVSAVKETLAKSNLGDLVIGDNVNIERSMKMGGRIDGHLVQGHVDQVAICNNIQDNNGSWKFDFDFDLKASQNLVIEKGSITVNGVSLTAHDVSEGRFSVSIIPYTFNHTNFKHLKVGGRVNIEFDMIGKYVTKVIEAQSF